ncbi:hypothetical protein DFH06DRAFT_1111973 [Mycena polygramma]|nr:hypothetical protein DFH06DRAFT_1111973 [Mycena polygramma]
MPEDNAYIRVDDLWFQDGNLVIRADNKIFKVIKSILAARSSVFRDMAAFPQPDTPNDLGGEKIDGCNVVVLHDSARDVEAFLRAIFDSSYFMPAPEAAKIHVILGILRLSHKYDVQYLHRRALRHMDGPLYFQSVQEFRNSEKDLPMYKDWDDEAVPLQCILATIQAAHEVSALWLLPIAYYHACAFANAALAGETSPGLGQYAQQRLKARLDLAREHVASISFLKSSGATVTCMLPRECNAARFAGLELYLEYVAAGLDVSPLQVWDQPQWTLMAQHGMTRACRRRKPCIPTRSTSFGTGFRVYSICRHGLSCTQ